MDLLRIRQHMKWHIAVGNELHQLGLPRSTLFRSLYQSRLRAFLSRKAVGPSAETFVVRHGISHDTATLSIRTGPSPDDLSDWIVLRGVWAHHDYFHPAMHDCRTILDVGANTGVAAVWFTKLIPEVQIACVEPDPRNIPLIHANLKQNGLAARVFECAVAPRAGTVRLGRETFAGRSSLESTGLYAHSDFIQVDARRIPEILDELGWDVVDLLKMDIEGAERDVLADAGDWLNRVRHIVLEVHPNTSPEELDGFLRPHGSTLEPLGNHEEPTYFCSRSRVA
jgi:FkbM family methyltransferase